jgi:hypothetical protein
MIQYGNLFAAEAAQGFQARSIYDDAPGQQRINMPPEDVDALVSYLKIVRQFAEQVRSLALGVQSTKGSLAALARATSPSSVCSSSKAS